MMGGGEEGSFKWKVEEERRLWRKVEGEGEGKGGCEEEWKEVGGGGGGRGEEGCEGKWKEGGGGGGRRVVKKSG